MRTLVAGACAALAIGLLLGAGGSRAAGGKDKDAKKPKYEISEVMQQAHSKDGLLAKVASGKGDKADAEKLLDLYIELAKNKPPAGEAKSWKKFTDGLIAAAKVAVAGGEDAGAKLRKAANCKGCHTAHKSEE
jgi:hypothetical protein